MKAMARMSEGRREDGTNGIMNNLQIVVVI